MPMSMRAVPDTVGVTIRRTNGSHAAMANWKSEETTMRLARVGSPPSVSANHRDGDEVRTGAGHEDMAGAESTQASGLQGGGDSGDDQRREDRPGKVGIALAGRGDDDRHHQDGVRQDENDALHGDAERHEGRARLVRLVPNASIDAAVTHARTTPSWRAPTGASDVCAGTDSPTAGAAAQPPGRGIVGGRVGLRPAIRAGVRAALRRRPTVLPRWSSPARTRRRSDAATPGFLHPRCTPSPSRSRGTGR